MGQCLWRGFRGGWAGRRGGWGWRGRLRAWALRLRASYTSYPKAVVGPGARRISGPDSRPGGKCGLWSWACPPSRLPVNSSPLFLNTSAIFIQYSLHASLISQNMSRFHKGLVILSTGVMLIEQWIGQEYKLSCE